MLNTMNKKNIFILFLFIINGITIKSQEDWMLYPKKDSLITDTLTSKLIDFDTLSLKEKIFSDSGSLTINKNPKLDSIANYIRENSYFKGFTVQIAFSQINSEIKDIRKKFIENFPEDLIFDEYNAPNVYLFSGKFQNKNEAYLFKEKISTVFKNSMVISKNFSYKINQQKKGNQN